MFEKKKSRWLAEASSYSLHFLVLDFTRTPFNFGQTSGIVHLSKYNELYVWVFFTWKRAPHNMVTMLFVGSPRTKICRYYAKIRTLNSRKATKKNTLNPSQHYISPVGVCMFNIIVIYLWTAKLCIYYRSTVRWQRKKIVFYFVLLLIVQRQRQRTWSRCRSKSIE